MHRDYRLYIDDILEAIANIKEYTVSIDYPSFVKDKKHAMLLFEISK